MGRQSQHDPDDGGIGQQIFEGQRRAAKPICRGGGPSEIGIGNGGQGPQPTQGPGMIGSPSPTTDDANSHDRTSPCPPLHGARPLRHIACALWSIEAHVRCGYHRKVQAHKPEAGSICRWPGRVIVLAAVWRLRCAGTDRRKAGCRAGTHRARKERRLLEVSIHNNGLSGIGAGLSAMPLALRGAKPPSQQVVSVLTRRGSSAWA